MSEANYFSTGQFEEDQFYHYGLAAEYYTHFTSPIRRYADVIVHRLLQLSVIYDKTKEVNPLFDNLELAKIADHLNTRNRNSKLAQMDSVALFQSIYFKNEQQRMGGVVAEGVITSIRANGFIGFIPQFGVTGPVYLKDKNGASLIPFDCVPGSVVPGTFTYDSVQKRIIIDTPSGPLCISRFNPIVLRVTVEESKLVVYFYHFVYFTLPTTLPLQCSLGSIETQFSFLAKTVF